MPSYLKSDPNFPSRPVIYEINQSTLFKHFVLTDFLKKKIFSDDYLFFYKLILNGRTYIYYQIKKSTYVQDKFTILPIYFFVEVRVYVRNDVKILVIETILIYIHFSTKVRSKSRIMGKFYTSIKF